MSDETLSLSLDSFQRLVVTLPGMEPVVGVTPIRCFPFAAPNEFISLCDALGKEIYCVSHLDNLETGVQKLLMSELNRLEFVPTIQRILYISPESEPTQWRVETDRGAAEFVLPNEDCVRRLDASGALITDGSGIRYRVPDIHRLDSRSRKLLTRYL
jgi:hypothetical protein